MKSGQRRARVVVVDDNDIARLGMVAILQSDPELSVVGEAYDAPGALEAVRRFRPDLVLLDDRMPSTEGLDAAREIRAIWPRTQVVMVSSWDAPEYVLEALVAGASGYISKGTSRAGIIEEVHRVVRGEPLAMSRLPLQIEREPGRSVPADAYVAVGRLTPRQRDVLSLIARGLESRAIAQRLEIAPGTVRKLTEQVYQRIGVSNRTQAAATYWVVAARSPTFLDGPSGSAAAAY